MAFGEAKCGGVAVPHDALLQRCLRDEAIHRHRGGLAKAMGPVHGLSSTKGEAEL